MNSKNSDIGASFYEARGLSKREAGLLADLERSRQMKITLSEVRERFGPYAADAASRLVKKGALQRVAPGVFVAVPFRAMGRPWVLSAPSAVAILMGNEPYRLGGLWAFTFHHLTTQQYGSLLDVFVKTKRRQRTLGNTKVLFHPVAPETLTWGVTRTRIESNEVIVSDRERTVLDALERPRLLGSLRILAALFPEVVAKLDVQQLVAYALRAGSTATCQRLGALLERVQTGPRVLAPLRRRVESSLSLLSLIPGEPRVGRLNRRWRVIENDR